jgi:hypothetical protein
MNMNYRLLIQKTYAAFLMVLVVTAFSFASVVATGTADSESTQGEITSFGFNNPTTVTEQIINRSDNAGANFTTTTSLSRSAEHQLVFDIRDVDGFDHLDVYVVLFKSDTKVLGDSGLALQYLNSGVSDNAFVIRWLSPERSNYLSGLTLLDPAETFLIDITSGQDNFLVKSGTNPLLNNYNSGLEDFVTPSAFNAQENVSWRVDLNSGLTSIELESGVVREYNSSNVEVSSGTRVIKRQVTIPLTISKVLPQSGVLNYAVIVYDRLQQETTTSKTGDVNIVYADNGTAYVVEFYGEITINSTPATVVFTDVVAGSGFFQQSVGTIEATFISNNIYVQSFSSDTTWLPNFVTDGLPEFAYLVPASGLLSGIDIGTRDPGGFLASQGNRFALRAFRETIALGGNGPTSPVDLRLLANDVAGFDQVLSSSSGVYAQSRSSYTAEPSQDALIAQADPTNELGVVSTFRFEIKLSPVFQTNHILNGVVQTTQYTGTIRLLISNG